MSKDSEQQQNFKSRVFFQLSNSLVILGIPWGCPNGDRSVIFVALSTQCMTHAFHFGSLTRRWETMSDCVHWLEPFYQFILMPFPYNSGTEFKGWHWFFCVWNLATVHRLHCPRVNWSGLTDSSEWLYQTRSNSSVASLKRTSSLRSVTSSHAWAQDLELKEDSKNNVLKCLNPVLLRLHNALLVRSHI